MTRRLAVASSSIRGGIPENLSWKGDGVKRIPARPTANWVEKHGQGIDVFHVARPPRRISREQAGEFRAALNDRGIPLVCTIHHPFSGDREKNGLALVPLADELIVPNAEVRASYEQFHDRVTLVPPCHVFPLDELDGLPPARRIPPFTISVVLAGLDPDPVAETIVEVVAGKIRESGLFKSLVSVELLDLDPARPAGSLLPLLAGISRQGLAEVRQHDLIGIEELLAVARQSDIVIVPRLTGVYCAWVEAFRDAGAAIVSPASEFSTEFRTSFPFKVFATGAPRREDICAAIDSAAQSLAEGRVPAVGADRRRHQRRLIAAQHAQIYRRAMLGSRETPAEPQLV